jgi:hypothetical protein
MIMQKPNLDELYSFLWIAAIGFFAAFSKEIHDRAHTKETFQEFIGEILLHGFCGWLIGIAATRFTDDLAIITVVSGVGGLFGFTILKTLVRLAIVYGAGLKNVKVDMKDIMLDDEDKRGDKDGKSK